MLWALMLVPTVASVTLTAECNGNGASYCKPEGPMLVQRHTKQKQLPAFFAIPDANASHGVCKDCCNDGTGTVPCLNVDMCASAGPENGRYAVVFSYAGKPTEDDFLPHVEELQTRVGRSMDTVLLMTKADAALLSTEQKRSLWINNVKLHRVDWAVPPDMIYQPQEASWCGQKDLLRLHALALAGYDAVAHYDSDVEFRGDITPVLRCAATGQLLTTSGGAGEPLGAGFFAVKPDPRMLDAARRFARRASFDSTTGWANAGFGPASSRFAGAECGQGLLHTLFYRRDAGASQVALTEAGLAAPDAFIAAQIDRCIWNYQDSGTTPSCPSDFDCTHVRAHYWPTTPQANFRECKRGDVPWLKRSLLSLGQTVTSEHTFGFWFPIHGEEANVLRVVGEVRQFYPDSPILLLQDGGNIDYSKVCQKPQYGCMFERAVGENSRWNPHSWFRRMRSGAQKLGTDYVIYLEPDVKVKHRHQIQPGYDAGGVYDNFNGPIGDQTALYLTKLGRERNPGFELRWLHFGLTGGSYVRTEALLDAFDPTNYERLDFQGLYAMEGEKVWSSDLSMHLALSARGWTVYPWEESAQNFNQVIEDKAAFAKRWPALNPEAAFEHNHKERYGEPVLAEDDKLLFAYDKLEDVTCHGCLWYQKDAKLPVPSEAPAVQNPADEITTKLSSTAFIALSEDPLDRPEAELPLAARGLPLQGTSPGWLVNNDALVLDGRKGSGGGGILVVQTVLMNVGGDWGSSDDPSARPKWLRAILASNRAHVRQHGHVMALRWQPTQPQLTPWQLVSCSNNHKSHDECGKEFERENFNWEKHLMMQEYLESSEKFSHVLLLDADGVLVRLDHDTLTGMAQRLEQDNKDILVADEDWLQNGDGRINGGMVFAKNSEFSRRFFRDTFDCHVRGAGGTWQLDPQLDQGCTTNEQLLLNDLKGKQFFKEHVMIESGKKYNRGGCTVFGCGEGISDSRMEELGIKDPDLEILHFMGGSKNGAPSVLCAAEHNLTQEGPEGYGCREEPWER